MSELNRDAHTVINYLVKGEGETVFLLFNGATLPLEFWGSLSLRLETSARVVRFDQRNAGRSRCDATAFSLNDVAADAAALLQALDCRRVVVIGHAWGGRVAQVFARDYPHLTRALVICCTGGQFPAVGVEPLQKALLDAGKAGDETMWRKCIESLYCARGYATRDPVGFAELCRVIRENKPVSQSRWDPRISPSPSYWGTASVPTLLVYGEEDRFGTPENAADLNSRIAGSRLLMMKSAGHFAIIEQQERTFAAIRDFVRDLV